MNNRFGPMKDTLRRIAQYNEVAVHHEPGYGDHAYRLTMEDGVRSASDVFWIENDGHLNRASNALLKRLLAFEPVKDFQRAPEQRSGDQ